MSSHEGNFGRFTTPSETGSDSSTTSISNSANASSMKVVQSNINFNVAEFYNNKHISLIIDSNSNIGVGISNPQGLLHLHKPLNDTDVTVKLTDANNTTGVVLKKDNNQDFYISNTNTQGKIILKTSDNERLRIDSIGNVGIGSTIPITNLDIGLGMAKLMIWSEKPL